MSRIVYTAPIDPGVYQHMVDGLDFDFPPWSEAILYHWMVDGTDVYACVELPDGTTFAEISDVWQGVSWEDGALVSVAAETRRLIEDGLAAEAAS